MKNYQLLFLFLTLLGCKKKADNKPVNECAKPEVQNFRSLAFTDNQGVRFFYEDQPHLNDKGDDWQTNKTTIPCYYKELMDNSHDTTNDITLANDTVISLQVFPNPGGIDHITVFTKTRKPALFHLLLVNEAGDVVYKHNFLVSTENQRLEGLSVGLSGYVGQETIPFSSLTPYSPKSYYRFYYYYSAKDNKCFNQGYGDVFLGKFYPFQGN